MSNYLIIFPFTDDIYVYKYAFSKKSTKRVETGNIELKPTIIFLVLVINSFNFLIYFNT